MGGAFTGPNRWFVEIPCGSHTRDAPVGGGSCTTAMFHDFAVGPSAPPFDRIDDVEPIDFAGTTELARQAFDTDDVREG
jgi:hypothetical protein